MIQVDLSHIRQFIPLPYEEARAAQLRLAGSRAKISPLEITINNWYCMLLAVAGILAIILGLPRIKARSTEA